MITIGTSFDTLALAKQAIIAALLKDRLSYIVYKTDNSRLILKCRDETCHFYVRAVYSGKLDHALLSGYKPHICGTGQHFDFAGAVTVKQLRDHHRAVILADRSITPSTCPLPLSYALYSYSSRANPDA